MVSAQNENGGIVKVSFGLWDGECYGNVMRVSLLYICVSSRKASREGVLDK